MIVLRILNKGWVEMNAATIFVHGFNGDAYSMRHLLEDAEENGWANKIIDAIVKRNGRIELKGTWNKEIDNPMIQVLFENNRAPERWQIRWVRKLLIQLKEQFGIAEFNGVGHSLGSNVLVNLAIKYGDDLRMPRLRKLVTIAGPFNGLHGFADNATVDEILENGSEPNHKTRHLRKLYSKRDQFPADVSLLNIVGQSNRFLNNDVYVSVESARSVGYLLSEVARDYNEIMVMGPDGYHCSLNHNEIVSREINNFLWNRGFVPERFKLISSHYTDNSAMLVPGIRIAN
ncbi:alpha/beta hydrolase superfamily protein [Pediococcus claussenii ATCC BAA-344]|uniref:Alpha/beta hydrolase superfamily protein n=2 Tax=Pediococcus claussenii TaxID=187452 RepID=G8PEC2_PEDCP|nr:alpha/beta hydrolase superfamily protein [Pediococcus claussenii ATCC BAA-344]KRN19355.1 hypothetical protein IV79_GL001405 [Pediococcus claussenii]